MTAEEADGRIDARNLTKKFGPRVALRGVDLKLAAGESLAMFGPNGAGKTTLIRLLSMGLRPNTGSCRIGGLDPRKDGVKIRQRIGLIGHRSYLYDDLSPRLNLEFFAALYGVADPATRVTALLESASLSRRADDPVRTLSRGMQQRVSLARALVHDPPVVFLDEPFTGLDPHAARMLRATLGELRAQKRTVVLVTHNLRQGLGLCERWAVLSRGLIVDEGRSADVDPEQFENAYLERQSAK